MQKGAMHVPSYFFLIDLNLYIVFMPFSLTSPSSLLKLPLYSLLNSTLLSIVRQIEDHGALFGERWLESSMRTTECSLHFFEGKFFHWW